jgi:hypothetical protein
MLRFCIDLVQSSSDCGPEPTASTIIVARLRLGSGSGIFADQRAQEPDPGAPSQSGDLPLYSDRAARGRIARPTQHEFAGCSGGLRQQVRQPFGTPIRAALPAQITACAGTSQRRQPALVKFNQDRVSARFRQTQKRRTNCASVASTARQ